MSFSSLSIGASSLYAAQRAAEIAAHNVANANTPGYTKQRLEITSGVPASGTPGMRGDGMRGTGVAVVGIDRLRDLLADLSYRNEAGASGAADTRSAVLDRAQSILGTYPEGASKVLDDFFKAWSTLADHPTDPAARSAVLNTGQQIASALGDAASQLDVLNSDIGVAMTDTVEQVNALATHVATLNQAISDAVTAGQSPNDLYDQRDLAVDSLATLAGATTKAGKNGQVDVYVGNGPLVVGVTSQKVEVTRSGSAWGVGFVGGPAGPARSAAPGGVLGANIRVSLVDLPGFGAELDDIAQTLASQVNTLHRGGYDMQVPPQTGSDFFSGEPAAPGVITARTIQVRDGLTADGIAVSQDGAPTDGSRANLMAALSTAGSPPIGSLLRGTASRLGSAAANAIRDAKSAHSGLAGADERRSASDGVNVDEEMVDLVKYQHAYEAAARVVSMADGFLDTIINRMGAGR